MISDSVIHLTPRYLPTVGGVEMVVKELCERLAARGYSVSVFTPDLREGLAKEEWINGVHVRRYRRLYGDPLYLPTSHFFRELRSAEASIIHVHNIHTSMPLAAVMLSSPSGLVLQSHYHRYGQSPIRGILLSAFKCMLQHLVLPRFHKIVANSAYEERILKEDFPGFAERTVHVEEAIDTQELVTVNRKPEKPQRILYIGNLLRYKNVDKLLSAFSQIPQHEDFRLVIIGDGPEGNKLKTQAQQLNVGRYVEWKSQVSRDDLLSEYSRASVFVNLSRLESFGRTIMEALYIGLPVVVAKDSAISDISHKGNVKTVDPANTSEVAKGILESLNHVPRNTVAGDWVNWDTYVSRMIQLYETLSVRTPFHSSS